MSCVILYRINDGAVQYITAGDGQLYEFPHIDDAVRFADTAAPNPTMFARLVESGQADFQIVELDEL